jgi:hypothetical protein
MSSPRSLLMALCLILSGGAAASANTILICRTVDLAALPQPLTVPPASVFRDGGRFDDPLAAFGGDRIALRVETIIPLVIGALAECGSTPARISSDSGVRAVTAMDNRILLYAGSRDLLQQTPPGEELFSLRARVLDRIP